MRKEVLLAGALLFSGGGVEAQGPSPTPIVEPSPTPEATPEVKLDVSPFLDAVRANLNYDAEPKFFRRMERRAENSPNKYFERTEQPDGYLIIYYPEGVGTQPKVGVRHNVTNGVGNDYNGVAAGLNFFATSDEVIIDIGKEGTLESDSAIDLFNFRQIRNKLGEYFTEPIALKDTEWTEKGVDYTPASTYKLLKTDSETWFIGGDQNGFMATSHQLIEIPIVGTDQVPSPEPTVVFGE